jgi:hypothetical protein
MSLKMGTVYFSETIPTYEFTRRQKPEQRQRRAHLRENVESSKTLFTGQDGVEVAL